METSCGQRTRAERLSMRTVSADGGTPSALTVSYALTRSPRTEASEALRPWDARERRTPLRIAALDPHLLTNRLPAHRHHCHVVTSRNAGSTAPAERSKRRVPEAE